MILSRRRFFLGASAALVAAPAIVRVAANLMPVSTRFQFDADLKYQLDCVYAVIENAVRPPLIKNEPASIVPGWITYASRADAPHFRPAFT
jgi:hypothetical protein